MNGDLNPDHIFLKPYSLIIEINIQENIQDNESERKKVKRNFKEPTLNEYIMSTLS